MYRKVYCSCDSDFQRGGGYSDITIYKGQPYQRGYGIGSFFRRFGIPVLKAIGKQLLQTGMSVGSDILSDRNFKESIRSRGKEGAKEGLKRLSSLIEQEGSGIRKRKLKRLKKSHDIFS